MRRVIATGPLSPKLVKHFAMATVGLTGLLALFTSDQDWGAKAQIGAVETQNRVITAEADKLGARRLAARLIIKKDPAPAEFGEETGYDFGGSGGAPRHEPEQSAPALDSPSALPPELPHTSGATVIVTNSSAPAGDLPFKKSKARNQTAPTAQEAADIAANSARRSGHSIGAD